jgi:hypothetical protein
MVDIIDTGEYDDMKLVILISYIQAMQSPEWIAATQSKYDALIENRT